MFRHTTTSHPADASVTAPRRGGDGILRVAAAALLVAGVGVVYDAAPAAHAETATVTTATALIAALAAGGEVTLGADITVTPDDGALAVGAGQTVSLDLAGYELDVTAPDSNAGIGVPAGTALTIDDSGTTGTLHALGSQEGAGIGADSSMPSCGAITIAGGTVVATGGTRSSGLTSGAGIGGAQLTDCESVTIHGGTVDATGGFNSAGIGGGGIAGRSHTGKAGVATIAITGGTVTATGGTSGAGIGGGVNEDGGAITISGGAVTAISPYEADGGAGIGGGFDGSNDSVLITGGTITARGAGRAAGIGGGSGGSGGTVTIDAGTVGAIGGDSGVGGGAGIGSGFPLDSTPGVGADLTIGASATVTVGGLSGHAIGGYHSFGTATNNGTLILSGEKPNSIDIPAGAALTNDGTIRGNGFISGAGTLANNGTIANDVTVTGDDLLVTGHHYRLRFDANGATKVTDTMPEDMTVLGTAVTAPLPGDDAFWKDGCRFLDWYPTAADTTTLISEVDLSNGGTRLSTDGAAVVVTAYAGYDCTSPPEHTVTFDSQGGTAVAPKNALEHFVISKPANPSYDGHTFVGWYTEASGGTAWNFALGVSADMTLYAHWTFTGYQVTFDAQGGSSVPAQTVTTSAAVPTAPTRDGYTFDGWFDAAEGGAAWNFATAVTSSMTLYAHWAVDAFTITFDAMGGTPATQTVTAGDGALVPRPAKTPVKDHADFDGWFTAGGSNWSFEDGVATSSMTLYAHWWTYDFTVTFDWNGGVKGPPPRHLESSQTLEDPGYHPDRDGYTFAGWYDAPSGGSLWTFGTAITADTTLYAHWTPVAAPPAEHTVTFDSQGGSAVASQSITDGGTVTKPTDPTRTGYTFDGWYTAATSGTAWDFGLPPVSDTTLYAHWTAATSGPPGGDTGGGDTGGGDTGPTGTGSASPTTTPGAPGSSTDAAPTTAPASSSGPAPSTTAAAGTSSSTTGTATSAAVTTFSSSTPPRHAPLPPDSDTGSAGFGVGSQTPLAGSSLKLTAGGFLPGSTVDFWLNSDPVYLGSAIADARGTATVTVTLDAAISGRHHVQAIGTGTDGTVRNLAQPITVRAALAYTGLDPSRPAGLAALLVLGGALLLAATRRRDNRRAAGHDKDRR